MWSPYAHIYVLCGTLCTLSSGRWRSTPPAARPPTRPDSFPRLKCSKFGRLECIVISKKNFLHIAQIRFSISHSIPPSLSLSLTQISFPFTDPNDKRPSSTIGLWVWSDRPVFFISIFFTPKRYIFEIFDRHCLKRDFLVRLLVTLPLTLQPTASITILFGHSANVYF